MSSLLEEGKKKRNSNKVVQNVLGVIYCYLLLFFFFSFSFSDLLGLMENSLAAPTWWRLLEEFWLFPSNRMGQKKDDMTRRHLNLILQETFLKFLVKWSWILFTYERSKFFAATNKTTVHYSILCLAFFLPSIHFFLVNTITGAL